LFAWSRAFVVDNSLEPAALGGGLPTRTNLEAQAQFEIRQTQNLKQVTKRGLF